MVAVGPEDSLRGTDAPGGCMIERASRFALRCGILSRRRIANNPCAASRARIRKFCVTPLSALCCTTTVDQLTEDSLQNQANPAANR
jgi:hypothetical protein